MEGLPSPPQPLSWDTRAALLTYNVFFPFALLCLLPNFAVRMLRRGKYRHKFGQRFSIYSRRVKHRLRAMHRPIWIHAVSVGEVLIALKLIAKLREFAPQLDVVLSTTTSTGFALARDATLPRTEVIYHPLDFSLVVARAMRLVDPARLVLVEAEVWPNLVAHARKRGAGIALVNARLSRRSEGRFRKFRWATAPIFRLLNVICVQEPEDINRWEALGVPRERLHCTGSIKFDQENTTSGRVAEFRQLLDTLGVTHDAPILLAGSTHDGEEEIIARIFHELRREWPDLFLILVPRHVERTPRVLAALDPLGLRIARRTELDNSRAGRADCLLVDTTGELRDWFHLGTVIFIGKSLTAAGGQNPIEAVMAGKPVVFGPHMENFTAIVRLLLAQSAAIQGPDADGLKQAFRDLLRDPARRVTQAARATEVLTTHRGATARTAQLLFHLAPERP